MGNEQDYPMYIIISKDDNLQNFPKTLNEAGYRYTVKPPKRGHFGTGLFDPSSEVVPFLEVGPYLVFYHTIGTVATYSTQIMATAKGV